MIIVNNKVFEKGIILIIILNLLAMVIESETSISNDLKSFLVKFEYFSISIFTIEYIIRTYDGIKRKIKYNSTFFGVIDLLAFLPFFIQSILMFDGRFIRIFRLFRVTRIIKLGRFSRSFELLGKCISNVRRELYVTFYIALVILFFSATGIYYLENPVQPENFSSILESFWVGSCIINRSRIRRNLSNYCRWQNFWNNYFYDWSWGCCSTNWNN